MPVRLCGMYSSWVFERRSGFGSGPEMPNKKQKARPVTRILKPEAVIQYRPS